MHVPRIPSLGRLKEEHAARLALLREEFLRDAAGPNAAGSVEAALDETGGWSPVQHFRLVSITPLVLARQSSTVTCCLQGGNEKKSIRRSGWASSPHSTARIPEGNDTQDREVL